VPHDYRSGGTAATRPWALVGRKKVTRAITRKPRVIAQIAELKTEKAARRRPLQEP